MQYLFRGPTRDLQGFIAAKGLPACLCSNLKNESSAHENAILYEKEKTVIWCSGLELFFQVLLIGKKRVRTLITSGLFTTWLSCPTDVCFGSEQHEHMTGRQTIIPRSFIPLAFCTISKACASSLFFWKSDIANKYILNLVSSYGFQRIKPSSGRYLQIASNCHSQPDDVHQDGSFIGYTPAEILKEN